MRILVVEDEERMALYLQKCLVAEGFEVEVSRDGESALARVMSGGFDAITLDIMLPGKNGYAVCREIRAAGIDIPILVLTAKDGEYDEADALDLGADDFLRKPFSVVVLVARLRALLRLSPMVFRALQGCGAVGDRGLFALYPKTNKDGFRSRIPVPGPRRGNPRTARHPLALLARFWALCQEQEKVNRI